MNCLVKGTISSPQTPEHQCKLMGLLQLFWIFFFFFQKIIITELEQSYHRDINRLCTPVSLSFQRKCHKDLTPVCCDDIKQSIKFCKNRSIINCQLFCFNFVHAQLSLTPATPAMHDTIDLQCTADHDVHASLPRSVLCTAVVRQHCYIHCPLKPRVLTLKLNA